LILLLDLTISSKLFIDLLRPFFEKYPEYNRQVGLIPHLFLIIISNIMDRVFISFLIFKFLIIGILQPP